MKRFGYIYDRICEPENLRLAYCKARRGKSANSGVWRFAEKLDDNLESLREDLVSENVRVGDYSYFPVYDPKERLICAASFRERVLHHAIMNICEPVFESYQVYDSYACRKGKGLDACLERTVRFCRKYEWYLKLDIHKYFDSIPHDRLIERLSRRFKDPRLLELFRKIIRSYSRSPGRGIPIGNLTSQYFANYYLGELDHFLANVPAHVRYMDDIVVFGSDKIELKRVLERVKALCRDTLGLELNEPKMNTTKAGLPFLGYVVRPSGLRLGLRAKRRFRRKIAEANRTENQSSAESLISFVRRADSLAFRRKVIFGSSGIGANRVNRGGSWNNDARNCRSANRNRNEPGYRNNNLGFRVALAPNSWTRRMPSIEQPDDPVPVVSTAGQKPKDAPAQVNGVDSSAESAGCVRSFYMKEECPYADNHVFCSGS